LHGITNARIAGIERCHIVDNDDVGPFRIAISLKGLAVSISLMLACTRSISDVTPEKASRMGQIADSWHGVFHPRVLAGVLLLVG
jgi:hypothetical protein